MTGYGVERKARSLGWTGGGELSQQQRQQGACRMAGSKKRERRRKRNWNGEMKEKRD